MLDAAGRVKIIKLGDLLGSRRFFFGNDRLQFQEVSRFFNQALADLDRFAGLAQDEDCQRGANPDLIVMVQLNFLIADLPVVEQGTVGAAQVAKKDPALGCFDCRVPLAHLR